MDHAQHAAPQAGSEDKPEMDTPQTERPAEAPTLQNLARVIRSSLAEHGAAPVRAEKPAESEVGRDFAATMDSVRRVAESLRAAEQRSHDLQAGLQAITERARREINSAEQRARDAQDRAEAAEARARDAEERLAQMMELIQREFAGALAAQAGAANAA